MTDQITTPAQMREAAALLPCPFCGSNNAIVLTVKRGDEHRMYPLVRCIGCYLDMPGQNGDYSTDGRTAIAAWNRRALPVAEQQEVRDKALEDAAQAVSNRATYWWDEATAADDAGRKKLSLSYEAKALACVELVAAIRVMKGTKG